MSFDLKEVLNTAGPTATLVFASWLFLQLVTMRFEGVTQRYEKLVEELRAGHCDRRRKDSLLALINLHRKRCEHMQRAMNLGLVAAMLLVASLLLAALYLTMGTAVLKLATLVASLTGLTLIIAGSALVILESNLGMKTLVRQFDDVPELADHDEHRRPIRTTHSHSTP